MNADQDSIELFDARREKAFKMVQPRGDWRGPIDTWLQERVLKQNALKLADVKEAILFYTATEANVVCIPTKRGVAYHVTAKGYRAGPAGP